ncbi:Putative membrane protein (fragment) [Thiomonas sp. CB2]
MPVGQLEQQLPLLQGHDRACGIARRANVEQLRALPHRLGHCRPIDREIALRIHRGETRLRASEQRSAFINLIERIGTNHRGPGPARVHHSLRDGEQRLPRSVDRQHLRLPVQRHTVAPARPLRARLPQFHRAGRTRIDRQAIEMGGQGVANKGRGGMLGFAYAQADRRPLRGRRHSLVERAQFFKRIRLKQVEARVHGKRWDGMAKGAAILRSPAQAQTGRCHRNFQSGERIRCHHGTRNGVTEAKTPFSTETHRQNRPTMLWIMLTPSPQRS